MFAFLVSDKSEAKGRFSRVPFQSPENIEAKGALHRFLQKSVDGFQRMTVCKGEDGFEAVLFFSKL
jgi:hypothetical protein